MSHGIEEWADFQKLLFDVPNGEIEEIVREIEESSFVRTESDIHSFLVELRKVMLSNANNMKRYAKLIQYVINDFDKDLNVPSNFLSVFSTNDKFTFLLYRELFLLGFVEIQDIVAQFHDPTYPKSVRRTLLVTFLPDLYNYDMDTAVMAANELLNQKDLFKTTINAEKLGECAEKIRPLLENGHPDGSIALILKRDDISELRRRASDKDFDFLQKIKSTEFELAPVNGLPLISACAMFGAVNCFKFLFLNNAQRGIEKNENSLAHAAVYGGNHEILHILQQNKMRFDGTLGAAAKSFRPDVFAWLIANFPVEMIIKPVTANGILTELIKNGDFISLISFFHSDLKERLMDKTAPVINAAKAADPVTFKYIFEQLKADPNLKNSSGYSLIHLVADTETAEYLYNIPTLDVAAVTKDGFTPLHEYASKGFVNLARLYLNHSDVSVSIQADNGMTPLHLAASYGKTEFVEFLLQFDDIDINAVDRDGNTPLHYAARASSKSTIEVLLADEEINTNVENIFNETPFFLAAKRSNSDVFGAICDMSSVDINQTDSTGKTALIYAIDRPCLSIFEYLLSVDTINVNKPDRDQMMTPLMHIVCAPQCDDIKAMFDTILIVHGLNVNAQDREGNTAVHLAAKNERSEMLTELLKAKGLNMMLSDGKYTVKEVAEMRNKANRRMKRPFSDFSTTDTSDGSIDLSDRRLAESNPMLIARAVGDSMLVGNKDTGGTIVEPLPQPPSPSKNNSILAANVETAPIYAEKNQNGKENGVSCCTNGKCCRI